MNYFSKLKQEEVGVSCVYLSCNLYSQMRTNKHNPHCIFRNTRRKVHIFRRRRLVQAILELFEESLQMLPISRRVRANPTETSWYKRWKHHRRENQYHSGTFKFLKQGTFCTYTDVSSVSPSSERMAKG